MSRDARQRTADSLPDQNTRLRVHAATEAARDQVRRDQQKVPTALQPVLQHLAEHLFDPSLTIRQALDAVGAPSEARNHLRAALGMPPGAYLKACRMDTAARILGETELGLATVAEQVGYLKPQNFSRAFEQWCGLKPSIFRLELAKGGDTAPWPADLELRRRALLGQLSEDELRALLNRLGQALPDMDWAVRAMAYLSGPRPDSSLSPQHQPDPMSGNAASQLSPSAIDSYTAAGPHGRGGSQQEKALSKEPSDESNFGFAHRIEALRSSFSDQSPRPNKDALYAELDKAERAWDQLVHLPATQRPKALQGWSFRTPALFYRLLHAGTGAPPWAGVSEVSWIELALVSLDSLDPRSTTVAEDAALQLEAHLLLARHLQHRDPAAAREALEKARSGVQRWPQPPRSALAEWRAARARLLLIEGKYRQGLRVIEQCLEELSRPGLQPQKVRALWLRACLLERRQEPALQLESLRRASRLAEAASAELHIEAKCRLARALANESAAIEAAQELDQARALLDPAPRQSSSQGLGTPSSEVDWTAAALARLQGDHQSAVAHLERVRRRLLRSGDGFRAGVAALAQAWSSLQLERQEDAWKLLREALPVLERLGPSTDTPATLSELRQAVAAREVSATQLEAVLRPLCEAMTLP